MNRVCATSSLNFSNPTPSWLRLEEKHLRRRQQPPLPHRVSTAVTAHGDLYTQSQIIITSFLRSCTPAKPILRVEVNSCSCTQISKFLPILTVRGGQRENTAAKLTSNNNSPRLRCHLHPNLLDCCVDCNSSTSDLYEEAGCRGSAATAAH